MLRLRRLSICQRLALVVLAIALPMNLLVVGVIAWLAKSAHDAQLASLNYSVRSIASGVEAHVSTHIALAQALASSPSLLDDDLSTFRAEAERAFPDTRETWLVVADVEGQQLMNLLTPRGAPLPRRNPDAITSQKRAFATRSMQVSNVFTGTAFADWIATVEIPVFKDGEPFRALAVIMSARGFSRLLNEQNVPHGWIAAIADRNGNFVAHVPGHDRYVSQSVSQGLRPFLGREDVFEYRSLEGDVVKNVTFVLPLSVWTVGVGARKEVFEAPVRATMMWAGFAGLAVSALSLALAVWVAAHIGKPVRELECKAAAVVGGETAHLHTNVPEIERVWSALNLAVAARAQSLRSLRESEQRLEHDMNAIRKLQDISALFVEEGGLPSALEKILEAAIAITDADMGTIQLFDPRSHTLRMIAHRGFDGPIPAFCSSVEEGCGTCGVALKLGQRVIVEDVTQSPILAGTPALQIGLCAQARASQSTPLISRSGRPLGVFSTYYKTPRRPEDRALRLLDLHARQAADIIERTHAEEHIKLLMHEVNHRAKNLLAIVRAVARQTAHQDDPQQFAELFSERIAGLAASHDLLVRSAWQGVDITDVVRAQLAHFEQLIGSRIVLRGPPLKLKPAAAQTVGMAVRELATNAAKYGALSNDKGMVRIVWGVDVQRGASHFRMSWTEKGGPPAAPPQKKGFGHKVMVQMVELGLEADVRLEYPRTGLVWEVVAPVASLLEPGKELSEAIRRQRDLINQTGAEGRQDQQV